MSSNATKIACTEMSPEFAQNLSEKLVKLYSARAQIETVNDERKALLTLQNKSRFSNSTIIPNPVKAIAFDPAERNLAYSRNDGSMTVFFLSPTTISKAEKRYIPAASGKDKVIRSIDWCPSGELKFVTTSNSSVIQIWTVDTASYGVSCSKKIILAQKSKVVNCIYNPTGFSFVALTKNEELHVFNNDENYTFSFKFSIPSSTKDSHITCMCWDNSGTHLYLGFDQGDITVLQFDNEAFIHKMTISGHRGSVSSIKVDPYERFMISSGSDGNCIFWNLDDMTMISNLTCNGTSIKSVEIAPLGNILAVVYDSGITDLYCTSTHNKIDTIQKPDNNDDVCLKFYPNKTWILMSNKNDMLKRYFTPDSHKDEIVIWNNLNEETASNVNEKNTTDPIFKSKVATGPKSALPQHLNKSTLPSAPKTFSKKRERDWESDRDTSPHTRHQPSRPSRYLNR